MNMKFAILAVVTLFLAQACTSWIKVTETSSQQVTTVPPVMDTSMPNTPKPIAETTLPELIKITPVISTAIIIPALPTLTPSLVLTESLPPNDNPIPKGGITLRDGGKTFSMRIGDSFLLNLGSAAYEWNVTVDNENVISLKKGVLVIQGAQGIFQALALGTATLSASGDPFCLKSKPACAMPSILFTVTLVVG